MKKIWKGKKTTKILSPIAILSILIFFTQASIELSISMWLASTLSIAKGFNELTANSMIVLYFSCIFIGRIGIGAISNKLGNRKILKYGMLETLIGMILLAFGNYCIIIFAVVLSGLSLSIQYPSMMHETHNRFDKSISSVMTGYQANASLFGTSIIVPALGLILGNENLSVLFPIFAVIVIITFILNFFINKLY